MINNATTRHSCYGTMATDQYSSQHVVTVTTSQKRKALGASLFLILTTTVFCSADSENSKIVAINRFLSSTTAEKVNAKMLELKNTIRDAPCSPLDDSLEGELVYLQGCPISLLPPLGEIDPVIANGNIPLEDLQLGIRLEAYSEVYQWEEFPRTKKVGNRNVREWLYFREWYPISPPSNVSFREDGRKCRISNGGRPCYQWDPADVESWWADAGYQLGEFTAEIRLENVTMGDYILTQRSLDGLTVPQVLQPSCSNSSISLKDGEAQELSCLPFTTTPPRTQLDIDGMPLLVWQQMDSSGEMLDYLSLSYTLYKLPGTISVLAQQRGNSFVPWRQSAGSEELGLFVFVGGNQTAVQLVEKALSSSATSFLSASTPFALALAQALWWSFYK